MTNSIKYDRENGFVLVIVLWFIALLSLMTAAFSLSARGGIRLVEVEITSAKERAILDGGIELAAIGLTMKDSGERWHADGRIYHKSIANIDLSIRMYDQSGRVDINKSDPELLIGLLQQVIKEQGQAEKIVKRIFAGRNDRTTHAKKVPARDTIKTTSRSRNMTDPKFMDISQLQYIPGITREIYRNIRPFVTVHSDDGRINPLTAPREVLLAIPMMKKNDVDAFLEIRRAGPADETLVERLPPATSKWISEIGGRAINVVVGIGDKTDRRGRFLSAVIMPSADKGAPYRVLRRRFISAEPVFMGGLN